MRVTLVSPFDPFPEAPDAHVGGVERVYAELAPRLAERGHEVTLVCSSDGLVPGELHEGVRVIRKPRAATVMRAPATRLHEAIPEGDVVQAPATYPLTTPAALRHAEKTEQASVLDFHFEPRPDSTLGQLAAALYRPLGARIYRRADRVLARSKAYAEAAPSLSQVPHERLRVVPNGVDPTRFTPEGPAREGDYLLFVGRLVPYKGLDVLLDALSGDPDRPRLVVAGDGPEREALQAQARRRGVDATFLGRVADDALPALYRGAQVTLLPSVNRQEAFGITLLESMACGTPVVASDLPGVAEVARRGGLVAPPGEPDELASRIDEARRGELPRGRELADPIEATYSWERVTDRTEAVYREVVRFPTDWTPSARRVRL